MVGSSKLLIRGLEAVLGGWETTQTPDTGPVFQMVGEYQAKHNTFPLIKQATNMSNELRDIYEDYVKSGENKDKELFFVELLGQLAPYFIEEQDVMAWTDVYLRPVLNSAGYDLKFVAKAREFFQRLVINTVDSQDDFLQARRSQIATKVVKRIIEAYLGKVKVTDDAPSSHLLKERLRFVQMNATNFLVDYGLKHTKTFLSILEPYVRTSTDRFAALMLLLALISHENSQPAHLARTPILQDILKTIAYDKDDTVPMAISILCMSLPLICCTLGNQISDVLFVYFRTIGGFTISTPSTEQNEEEWQALTHQQSPRVYFDCLCLMTLLYGLFPFNVIKFCRLPELYLATTKGPLFGNLKIIEFAVNSHADPGVAPGELDIINEAKNRLTAFLLGLSLHPKLLNTENADLKLELELPLEWISLVNHGKSMGSDDIALACYSLNPSFLNLGESYPRFVHLNRSLYSADPAHNKYLLKHFGTISRNSMSTERQSSIVWKEVDFGDEKAVDQHENSQGEPDINELFNIHEKLYHGYSKRSLISNSNKLEDDEGSPMEYYERELLLMKNELHFLNYVQHLTKIKLFKLQEKLKQRPDSSRKVESLQEICKELEMAVKLIEEELSGAIKREKALAVKYEESLKKTQQELVKVKEEHSVTVNILKQKESELHNLVTLKLPDNNALISDLQMRIKDLESRARPETPLSPTLINGSRQTISTNDYFGIASVNGSPLHTSSRSAIGSSLPNSVSEDNNNSPEVTAAEAQMVRMRMELIKESEVNRAMTSELEVLKDNHRVEIQSKEHTIARLKQELANNAALRVSHYERKVQELSTTIIKYESQLEQRNIKIAQLTTSRPISIPSTSLPLARNPRPTINSQNVSGYEIERESKTRSNSLVDSLPSPPGRISGSIPSSQPPIMKGRGGYQKRIKKMM